MTRFLKGLIKLVLLVLPLALIAVGAGMLWVSPVAGAGGGRNADRRA